MKTSVLFFLILMLFSSCIDNTFIKEAPLNPGVPSNLEYMDVINGREGKTIVSSAPSVSTGGLIPYFEIVNGYDGEGNLLDESYMKFVSIANPEFYEWNLGEKDEYPVNEDGEIINSVTNVNLAKAGVITIIDGNNFTVGDYYFTIKVTTRMEDETFSTVFDKAFHIYIEPLLPPYLIYQLKTQNLVYGDPDSETNEPLIPIGNKDVRFSIEDNTDKLSIDAVTGRVALTPGYVYNGYDTIRPTIKVTSNISNEAVSFSNSLVIIVTDVPQVMPVESIYLFYPTLATTGTHPTGGDGFSVQVLDQGIGARIWGPRTNSTAGSFATPPERPGGRTQNAIEAITHANVSGVVRTIPTNFWCIMTPQDLTPYNIGYKITLRYYYMANFQNYMADGRTPTDMEVYISTDYTGGPIQNEDGSWTNNGTWTQINEEITCSISQGVSGGVSTGAPWGEAFVGTPYPGNQQGADPDGKKNLERGTVYGKWIKCSYDITEYKENTNFTVAFKVASYFTGELIHNDATVPGRGGSYFITDFHYVAEEVAP